MTNIATRTYGVAGVCRTPEGVIKVRYSDHDVANRVKLYQSQKCTDIEFFNLGQRMTKIEICNHLLTMFSDKQEYVTAINLELSKKEALVTPKVAKKRGPKPKAKPAAAAKPAKAPKATKPAKAPKAAAKAVKAAPAAKKLEIGEVETLEVIEDDLTDDFDIRQFEQMAAEQL